MQKSLKNVASLGEMLAQLSFIIPREICRAQFMETTLPSVEKKNISSG